MEWGNKLYDFLNVSSSDKKGLKALAVEIGVEPNRLEYWNANNILPPEPFLDGILKTSKRSLTDLKLKMGIIDMELVDMLSKHSQEIARLEKPAEKGVTVTKKKRKLKKVLSTSKGQLYRGDCLEMMSQLKSESIDLVFADPPFNLDKLYPSGIDDNLKETEYIRWSESWLNECVRILKPGGSLFVWNLPKWNILYAKFLGGHMTFKNWIACDIKYSLPIANRLYPSHYSLLYFTKGTKANVFKPDRLPMEVCPSCHRDLKDYGGYKDKMNPKGVNLSDVWYDIPPVRHKGIKRRAGANELSVKLIDRIIEMSTNENDVVFDPFGGSGTTYAVADIKKRKWIGVEIGPVDVIIKRLKSLQDDKELLEKYRARYNSLFPKATFEARIKKGMWVNGRYPSNRTRISSIINRPQLELEI
ncbi:MAG: site-specific DNA-methyltransferase [Cyclobacteriaceae bacterium]|nr:site-specific DNA-methyltransferase [Cyclobacteriaceae bacterium]